MNLEAKKKPIKKKVCKCPEYKKEIIELHELIAELRIKEIELNKLKSNFTDVSYGNESVSLSDCSDDSIKFPTLKQLEGELEDFKGVKDKIKDSFESQFTDNNGKFDNDAFNAAFDKQKEIDQQNDLKSCLDFQCQDTFDIGEPDQFTDNNGKFNNDAFNAAFEQQQKSGIKENLTKVSFIDPKAEYNPNFLPPRELSGFEPFDNDAFNKAFEEQKSAGIQVNSVLSGYSEFF